MEKVPTMLTINQASAATGLSYTALRQMIRENRFRYIQVGAKYLINLESLIGFLNGEVKNEIWK